MGPKNSVNVNLESLTEEQKNQVEMVNKNSFDYLTIIGKGGFGKVWKVLHRKSKLIYAMKEMSKTKIIDTHSEVSVKSERDILSNIFHPFIINMQYAFQDKNNLYLVLDYITGGDLRYHLCMGKKFTEEESKFIIANIVLSLEYIHNNNVIHRDLKPENLIFDNKGYLKLTDFGIAKIYKKNMDNSYENSGTPGYMAPEVLCNLSHNMCVDYYALGIITFEFMFRRRPYNGKNRREIKEQIMSKQVQITGKTLPKNWSLESGDFINKLIMRKPNKRLGFKGIESIKEHPWLKYFNWKDLYLQKMTPPFVPKFSDNFNQSFFNTPEKEGLETKQRYLKIMTSQKYIYEFKAYEYYDRKRDNVIKSLIEQENILSENDDYKYEIREKDSRNKKKSIKKTHLSMDDLNGIILKNPKKTNLKSSYVNPHLIYKALEEKEKNAFSDEENDNKKIVVQKNISLNKRNHKNSLGKSLSQILNFKHKNTKENCKSEVNPPKIYDKKKIILYKKINSSGPIN